MGKRGVKNNQFAVSVLVPRINFTTRHFARVLVTAGLAVAPASGWATDSAEPSLNLAPGKSTPVKRVADPADDETFTAATPFPNGATHANAVRANQPNTDADRAAQKVVPAKKRKSLKSVSTPPPPAASIVQNQRGGVVDGKTLEDAFNAALHQSESISIQAEAIKQANEGEKQATGAIFPSVNGTAGVTQNHYPSTNAYSAVNNGNQATTKLSLDQPLFRGLREFAAIRQKKAIVQSQVYLLRDSARQLFNSLATAYYNVLALQGDEQNYMNEIEIYNKRTDELKRFLRIGRSRETDLLTFEVSLATLQVQLETTRGQLEQARDVLAYFTGWNRTTPVSDEAQVLKDENLPGLLTRVDDRPDVRSALANAKAAGEGVPIARGAHLPSVDLVADYYHDHPGYETGGQDWDVGVLMTIPIYEGGVLQSQVRQAQSVATQSDLQLSSARRLAEQEIRVDFDAYQADLKQIEKLEEAVQLSEKSYESEVRDYRNGLVTNLDVLTAINAYQDSQRTLDHQKWTMNMDRVKLQAATGQRQEIAIEAKSQ